VADPENGPDAEDVIPDSEEIEKQRLEVEK